MREGIIVPFHRLFIFKFGTRQSRQAEVDDENKLIHLLWLVYFGYSKRGAEVDEGIPLSTLATLIYPRPLWDPRLLQHPE